MVIYFTDILTAIYTTLLIHVHFLKKILASWINLMDD